MAGLVIIGFDFGMALTKCAVAIQPPNQTVLERVVVAFQDPDGEECFYLPSRVWTNSESISLNKDDLHGDVDCRPELKRLLLEAWSGADTAVMPGVLVTECAFFLLTRILARVRRAVDSHLRREYPGATWTWMVNAATPCERNMLDEENAREEQMKQLMAQVLAFVEQYPNIDGASRHVGLRAEVAQAKQLAQRNATARRVTVVRESLAAALFALQADDAVAGTWLTVDVGALTTDTSLFFFSPETGPDDVVFRIAAYYAMTSAEGGMQLVATALMQHDHVPPHVVDATIGALSAEELESMEAFTSLTTIVSGSIANTLRIATAAEDWYDHLFSDNGLERECQFRLLLVGGGSCVPAMITFFQQWNWHVLAHVPPDVVEARIPQAFGVLSADGVVDHDTHPHSSDHPILSIACGLAQQPWEMPRFDNLPLDPDRRRVHPPERADPPWWGGN